MGLGENRKMQTLHFTFGPVQDFVAQARKTRDLWAGSCLLSYLAGKAMMAIIAKKGEITLPPVKEDKLLEIIKNPKKADKTNPAVRIGSLPNRFTAKVPDNVDGKVCEEAVEKAWRSISDAVLNKIDLHRRKIDTSTWRRQIDNFWEYQWVLGEETYLLDQRKNMRCHLPKPEPGEKCTICGERKELSNLSPSPLVISKINQWWDRAKFMETRSDLRTGERLCAVCLTKRWLPLVAEETFHWRISKGFPSVSYMAAVDWLIRLIEASKSNPDLLNAAEAFIGEVKKNIRDASKQYQIEFPELEKRLLANNFSRKQDTIFDIIDLDGTLFHMDAVSSKDLEVTQGGNLEDVKRALRKLNHQLGEGDSSGPGASPFFALLLMDGDNMGKLVSRFNEAQRQQISNALKQFTDTVPYTVAKHAGWLIYAGGDDVFALLPLDRALACAIACRRDYCNAFAQEAAFVEDAHATISAAIEYAHMKTPLGPLIKDAHRLLDEVAKEHTGRDSVACRVWKRGGPILTWAQPWEKILHDQENISGSAQKDNMDIGKDFSEIRGNIISDVRMAFQHDSDDPAKFSSKFFYKLRDLFDFAKNGNLFSAADFCDLLTAEYLANREHQWDQELTTEEIRENAAARVKKLILLCTKFIRRIKTDETKDLSVEITQNGYQADGALLVRFLSQKEV
jgi:CRISPR-associated protein Cmr2